MLRRGDFSRVKGVAASLSTTDESDTVVAAGLQERLKVSGCYGHVALMFVLKHALQPVGEVWVVSQTCTPSASMRAGGYVQNLEC